MGIAERKEREFQRRESEILQAALRLFEREDWQQVTIERIAQEAEIGKGTVYLHFASKEDIYGRLALEFSRQLRDELRRIDPALHVVERLRAAILVIFEAYRTGGRAQQVVDYCNREDFRRRLDAGLGGELQRVDDEITGMVMAVLQEGIALGIFPDRPLERLLWGPHATLIGAVRMLAGTCGCPERPVATELVEEVSRYMLAGLMFQEQVPALAPAADEETRQETEQETEKGSAPA